MCEGCQALTLKEIGVQPPETLGRFLVTLNTASVSTRYPDDMDELEQNFETRATSALLHQAEEALTWIKVQLQTP